MLVATAADAVLKFVHLLPKLDVKLIWAVKNVFTFPLLVTIVLSNAV